MKQHETTVTNHMPQVSIGMPVFNGEKYICEALDSLLAQTFTDFELIISDNTSSDNTMSICQSYAEKDRRIKYIRQDANIGAINNYKFVLKEANGDFFIWLAHDDIWGSKWLEGLLAHAKKQDDLCVVYGEARVMEDGILKEVVKLPDFKKNDHKSFFLNQNKKALYLYGLFRTKFLKKEVSYLIENNCLSMDSVFLYSLLDKINLVCSDSKCFIYRVHSHQASARKKRFTIFRLLKSNLFCYYVNIYKATPADRRVSIAFLSVIHYMLSYLESLKRFYTKLNDLWQSRRTIR